MSLTCRGPVREGDTISARFASCRVAQGGPAMSASTGYIHCEGWARSYRLSAIDVISDAIASRSLHSAGIDSTP